LNEITTNTLILLDESTSAIDIHTESTIYQTMLRLHVWFITISHRPSLKFYHSVELKLEDGISEYLERDLEDNKDESNSTEINLNETNPTILDSKLTAQDIKVKETRCYSSCKSLVAIWRLIHLPFDPKEHKTLRIQVSYLNL
jgi:hypothetical protein